MKIYDGGKIFSGSGFCGHSDFPFTFNMVMGKGTRRLEPKTDTPKSRNGRGETMVKRMRGVQGISCATNICSF